MSTIMKVRGEFIVLTVGVSALAVALVACAQSSGTITRGTQPQLPGSVSDSTNIRQGDVPGRDDSQPLLLEASSSGAGSRKINPSNRSVLVSTTDGGDDDGRNDAKEVVDDTNPKDSNSFQPVRLSYWRFNGSNWFRSEEGYPAISHSGANNPQTFDGGGLQIKEGGQATLFQVNTVESDGHANINFQQGAISFMFRPDWSTSTGGPGHESVLFQAGRKNRPGYWAWRIGSDGSGIFFLQSRDLQVPGQPVETVSSAASINFQKGTWYRVLLGWTDSFSEVRIDGVEASTATRAGVGQIPGRTVREAGFHIGSDDAGASQINGTFDEIQIFNAPVFSTLDTYDVYSGASATIVAEDTMELRWRNIPGSRNSELDGYRKLFGDTNWASALFKKSDAWSYDDGSLTPGRYYEYFLNSKQGSHVYGRFIAASIRGQPIHQRGRVLLLIDETVNTALSAGLDQLESDLVGDGWKVSRMKAPRQNGSSYRKDMARIVSDLKTFAVAQRDLEMIYIIGHVVIPYSGRHNPDGHGLRPFVADGLYGGVLDDTMWEDRLDVGGGNTIGDGKFDPSFFPSELKYGVGRVDFANLPAFEKGTVNPPSHEIDLLQKYMRRAHDYRHGRLRFPDRASFYTTSGSALERIMAQNATRTVESLFGDDLSRIRHVNDFAGGESFLWSFHAGTGGHGVAHTGNPSDQTSTSNLAEHVRYSNSGFYLLDGSYLGEWDRPDSLLRALLANGNGLGSSWARETRWRLHDLSVGLPIGTAIKHSINLGVSENINALKATYLSYLGDPTLRMQVLSAPLGIAGSTTGSNVVLSWVRSPDPAVHYYVYRSESGRGGDFTPLNEESPLSSSRFTASRVSPAEIYQVRAARLVSTGGGSFTNLSQAAYWP